MTLRNAGDLLRGAGGDDAPAAVAAFGPEVDHPVGGLDDIQVVLDHHHRVARIAQPVQYVQQQADVVKVQSRGRFIQYVQGAAGVALGEFQRELDALRLAARERGGRLAELDVGEADVR